MTVAANDAGPQPKPSESSSLPVSTPQASVGSIAIKRAHFVQVVFVRLFIARRLCTGYAGGLDE
jgi:hypothetical protein